MSSVIPLFRNAEERFTPKSYRLVIHLSVTSKVFEKLVNNRFFDRFEKCSLFSDLQHGLRSSRQLYLIKLLGLLIGLRLMELLHVMSKAFDRVAGLFLPNANLTEFHVEYLTLVHLFSAIDSFACF